MKSGIVCSDAILVKKAPEDTMPPKKSNLQDSISIHFKNTRRF
jgi:hypothetical protein